jgi:hypothetical protein
MAAEETAPRPCRNPTETARRAADPAVRSQDAAERSRATLSAAVALVQCRRGFGRAIRAVRDTPV